MNYRALPLISVTVTASLLVLSSSAIAAIDCGNAMTQADMSQCAASELDREDKKLNAAYSAYRKKLSPEQQQQFKNVQLAWIKFRDLACTFESSSSSGGSVHGMAMGSCLKAKTMQRTADIEAMSKCEEGDVTCVR